MKQTVRAILYEQIFDAWHEYAIEPNTGHYSYYCLGVIHGIERAINVIDNFDYLSDATHKLMIELIKAKKGGEN